MAIPKKRRKLSTNTETESIVDQALKEAEKKSSTPVKKTSSIQAETINEKNQPNKKTSKSPPRKSTKKISNPLPPTKSVNVGGRPSPRDGKGVKSSFILTSATRDRFDIAVANEKIKRRANDGGKVDISLILEEALIEWMERYGY